MKHFLQGYLQNLHLISGTANGHLYQCPAAQSQPCPTCGEFTALREAVAEMQEVYVRQIKELQLRVSEAELSAFPKQDRNPMKRNCA